MAELNYGIANHQDIYQLLIKRVYPIIWSCRKIIVFYDYIAFGSYTIEYP
ncbi:hypothetical protein SPCV_gp4 [Sweet potato collusive virus]|uniref:Uncharacterized protein n=1 Tax=Sweet potato collusive virus TaxID=930168 RepID=F2XXY6_9VIRU|nr:hypothetical protein SPCV_gp4 [Sweet potato collusive virus]AEA36698.1 hypothetical protein [Sweet potato collusive virus]